MAKKEGPPQETLSKKEWGRRTYDLISKVKRDAVSKAGVEPDDSPFGFFFINKGKPLEFGDYRFAWISSEIPNFDLNESYQYERIDIVIRTKLVQGTNFPVNLAIGTYYIEEGDKKIFKGGEIWISDKYRSLNNKRACTSGALEEAETIIDNLTSTSNKPSASK